MVESSGGKNELTSSSFVGLHCGQVQQQFIMNSAFYKEMEFPSVSQLHF